MIDSSVVDCGFPPAEVIAALDRRALKRETPCGRGTMVWRLWGQGPPLVLLHGSFGSWTHWIRNIPVFATRFTVLAPDLPGLGDSAQPPSPHSAKVFAGVLVQGLQSVMPLPTRLALIGFSFGSVVGGHVVAADAKRFTAFIAVGASGLGLPRNAIHGLKRPAEGMAEADIETLCRRNLRLLMFADPARIDPLSITIYRRNVSRARFDSRSISASDSLAKLLPNIRQQLAGAIWGARDAAALGHLQARRRLFKAVQQNCHVSIIPDAGHWVMYEAAASFNAAVLKILAPWNRPANGQ